MDHARVVVRFPLGEILFGNYEDLLEQANPSLFFTREEAREFWLRGAWKHEHLCVNTPETVEIATNHHGGAVWSGTACRFCMALVPGQPPSADRTVGMPAWWPAEGV